MGLAYLIGFSATWLAVLIHETVYESRASVLAIGIFGAIVGSVWFLAVPAWCWWRFGGWWETER